MGDMVLLKRKRLWRVDQEELKYIAQAIESGLTGKMTKILENRFAEIFGVNYAIAVNSGTSALHAAMLALNIGEGDEVIVPPLTFAATAFAPLYVGAIPIFADIEPDTFNISPKEILKKITPRTKAIIAVNLYGLPANLAEIKKIADEHHLKLIEDNAQCVMGKCHGKLAGTFGEIAIFSFQRSKHLTAGDGGIVITNHENVALKIRKIADLGYTTLTAKPISNENFKEKIQHPNFKRHDSLGYNFRLPELCSAALLGQLDKLNHLLTLRVEIARLYQNAVQGCHWLIPQQTPKDFVHSYWTFVCRLDIAKTSVTWEKFRQVFLNEGGESFYGAWSLNYLEPAFKNISFPNSDVEYKQGLCPIAESIQPYLIQLKTNFEQMEYAKHQANILKRTIQKLSKL